MLSYFDKGACMPARKAGPGTTGASTSESKHERFERLAAARASVIKDKLHSLGHLTNRQQYSFDRDDVDKLFGELEGELRRTRDKFEKVLKPKD